MPKLKKVLVTVVTSVRRNKNVACRKSALFLCSINFYAVSTNSSYTFRDILLTRFHSDFFHFSKGHNTKMGDNSDMKKFTGQLFFHEESMYKFQNPSKLFEISC